MKKQTIKAIKARLREISDTLNSVSPIVDQTAAGPKEERRKFQAERVELLSLLAEISA